MESVKKEKTLYLMFPAHTRDDNNCDVNSAMIPISKKIVRQWLNRISFYTKLKKAKEDLSCMDYWDTCTWIKGSIGSGEEYVLKTEPTLNENDYEQADDNTIMATEVDRMHVDEYGIILSAYLNGSSILVETEEITIGLVKKLYTALSAKPNRLPLLINTIDWKPSEDIIKLRMKEK